MKNQLKISKWLGGAVLCASLALSSPLSALAANPEDDLDNLSFAEMVNSVPLDEKSAELIRKFQEKEGATASSAVTITRRVSARWRLTAIRRCFWSQYPLRSSSRPTIPNSVRVPRHCCHLSSDILRILTCIVCCL